MAGVNAELDHVLSRLEMLLDDLWDQQPMGVTTSDTAPLTSLGVDSLTLALLLEKVGKEFEIDWATEAGPGGTVSLRSLADLVVRRHGGGAPAVEA